MATNTASPSIKLNQAGDAGRREKKLPPLPSCEGEETGQASAASSFTHPSPKPHPSQSGPLLSSPLPSPLPSHLQASSRADTSGEELYTRSITSNLSTAPTTPRTAGSDTSSTAGQSNQLNTPRSSPAMRVPLSPSASSVTSSAKGTSRRNRMAAPPFSPDPPLAFPAPSPYPYPDQQVFENTSTTEWAARRGSDPSTTTAVGSSPAGRGKRRASGQLLSGLGGLEKGLGRVGSAIRRNLPDDGSGRARPPARLLEDARKASWKGSGGARSTLFEEGEERSGSWERVEEGDPGITKPFNVEHDLHVSPDLADLPPAWLISLKQQGLTDADLLLIAASQRRQRAVPTVYLDQDDLRDRSSTPDARRYKERSGGMAAPPSAANDAPSPADATRLKGHASLDCPPSPIPSQPRSPSPGDTFERAMAEASETSSTCSETRHTRHPDQYLPPGALSPRPPPSYTSSPDSPGSHHILRLPPTRKTTKRLSDQLRGFASLSIGETDDWAKDLLNAVEEKHRSPELNHPAVAERSFNGLNTPLRQSVGQRDDAPRSAGLRDKSIPRVPVPELKDEDIPVSPTSAERPVAEYQQLALKDRFWPRSPPFPPRPRPSLASLPVSRRPSGPRPPPSSVYLTPKTQHDSRTPGSSSMPHDSQTPSSANKPRTMQRIHSDTPVPVRTSSDSFGVRHTRSHSSADFDLVTPSFTAQQRATPFLQHEHEELDSPVRLRGRDEIVDREEEAAPWEGGEQTCPEPLQKAVHPALPSQQAVYIPISGCLQHHRDDKRFSLPASAGGTSAYPSRSATPAPASPELVHHDSLASLVSAQSGVPTSHQPTEGLVVVPLLGDHKPAQPAATKTGKPQLRRRSSRHSHPPHLFRLSIKSRHSRADRHSRSPAADAFSDDPFAQLDGAGKEERASIALSILSGESSHSFGDLSAATVQLAYTARLGEMRDREGPAVREGGALGRGRVRSARSSKGSTRRMKQTAGRVRCGGDSTSKIQGLGDRDTAKAGADADADANEAAARSDVFADAAELESATRAGESEGRAEGYMKGDRSGKAGLGGAMMALEEAARRVARAAEEQQRRS